MSFIDKDYPDEGHKPFDNAFMRGLYGFGLKLGQSSVFWKKHPPDQDD